LHRPKQRLERHPGHRPGPPNYAPRTAVCRRQPEKTGPGGGSAGLS
jgi:hypothetical protein